MKRVIIMAILMPCMLGIAIYAMHLVDRVENEVIRLTDSILAASEREDLDRAVADADALLAFWTREEKGLSHYVRHSQVEALGQGISRIPALARYGTPAELQSELAAVRWQMENVKRSEAFAFGNIW